MTSLVLSITTNACGHNMYTFLPHLASESGKKILLTDKMDLSFKWMKAFMAQDCLLAYPNHLKTFHIYTDAFSYEMVACFVQENKPVSLWSCKLFDMQIDYKV